MKIGLYVNLKRDIDGQYSKYFIDLMKKRGIEYRIIDPSSEVFPDEAYYSRDEVLDFADFMAVFGGDGTVLGIAVDAAKKKIPIFGINVGNLGFLSEIIPDRMEEALDKILAEEYFIENRELIKLTYSDKEFFALNEIILNRTSFGRIIKIDVLIDGILADTMRADGLLVSTPTGSTAYSLASGGPILSPNIKAFIVNSICPHSLNTRPMVISSTSKVTLRSTLTDDDGGIIIVDGKVVDELHSYEEFNIERANADVRFLRIEETNFYNRLLNKMNTWTK